jgi:NAD(P)H-dependent FMN reductase
MKILALNASYRPEKTTTQLIRKALEGAASQGAETEMILLNTCRIAYCLNCLKCYQDLVSEIAPCSQTDDMDVILEKIREADGIIFGSPVHNGFVTGLMTVFFERLSWRVARPNGPFLGVMTEIRSRLTAKTRALAAISSAGGMPAKMRKFCDDGTPWLKSNAALLLHGAWIGDLYAGAVLKRMPRTVDDWNSLYFLRKLSPEQVREAEALGVKMVKALKDGNLQPVTLNKMVGPFSRGLIKLVSTFSRPYQLIDGP